MSDDDSTKPRHIHVEVDGKKFRYNTRTERFTRIDKERLGRKPIATDAELRNLKGESVEYEAMVADHRGLRVRVSPLSKISFYHRYKSPVTGKLRKLHLGEYIKPKGGDVARGMLLVDAKLAYNRNRELIALGLDPREEQNRIRQENQAEQKRKEARNTYTVTRLIDSYIEGARGSMKTWREVERLLNKDFGSALGDRSAYEITRDDIRQLIAAMRDAGRVATSNRLLSSIKRCYAWAIDNGWPTLSEPIEANPAREIKRSRELPRTRTLNNAEIAALVKKLPAVLDLQTSDFLLFLLLTGCRIGEASTMRWADLHGHELHFEETKNSFAHTVYLSDFALGVLSRQPRVSDFVWPQENVKHGHIDSRKVANLLADAMDELGLKKFTPHDLRRTMATWVAGNKGGREVRDRMLNHVTGGIDGVYNLHQYNDEARDQWWQWSDHVQSMNAPTVHPMVNATA